MATILFSLVQDFFSNLTQRKRWRNIHHSKILTLKQFHTFSWLNSNLERRWLGRQCFPNPNVHTGHLEVLSPKLLMLLNSGLGSKHPEYQSPAWYTESVGL